jgi:hypothetical protein
VGILVPDLRERPEGPERRRRRREILHQPLS